MTTVRANRFLNRMCAVAVVFTLQGVTTLAQQPMPKTSTQKIAGTPEASTEVLKGVVDYVEGNDLSVRMSTGDLRLFHVPESRRFLIDGKEVSVRELKPGTSLTATVTTTTTPITQRTTTVGTGKVWHVSGRTVILTLPDGTNKMYKVEDSYRFTVEGKPASVYDLRKGMTISAQKIVEEPMTEISTNTQVVGQGPRTAPARTEVAQASPQARPTAAAAPSPSPAPQRQASPSAAPEQAAALPSTLPKTGSELPFVGLLGLVLICASFGVRRLCRP